MQIQNEIITQVSVRPQFSIVVPTLNERDNIAPVVAALQTALKDVDWEVIFVDDDSSDGTIEAICEIAETRPNIRHIRRIGRRGLSGACIEGIQASLAQIVAVMDADLQHDVDKLPEMFQILSSQPNLDLVIGSRHVDDGAASGGFGMRRAISSNAANFLTKRLLGIDAMDPMSGFFAVRRASFDSVIGQLQSHGFKILADMLSVSNGAWQFVELPYEFQPRKQGQSKLDYVVALEFFGLLVSRLFGGLVSIRFVLFALVGLSGVAVQLAVVWLLLTIWPDQFVVSQTIGVFVAMTSNFILNNNVTYRDTALHGRDLLGGLLSFYVVCSLGAFVNIGIASVTYTALPIWIVASLAGTVFGALWNFFASARFTWKFR